MSNPKVAVIQMHVEEDKMKNMANAAAFVKEAAEQGADIAILPEMFNCPYKTSNFPIYAEEEGGECYRLLSGVAKSLGIYLVAGTMPEKDSEGKVYNTSYVFDREGRKIGKHRKMHLFDIAVKGGQHFRESDTLTAGNSVTVFETEFGRIGLAVCYDFRFPELARLMVEEGAKAVIVPAAFNMTTGPAHWEVMFRSRAIDNQVYTIGAAPARDVDSCYISYGNSIVVSPWGEVLLRMDEKEGIALETLDFDYVEKIREQLPLLLQRRKDIYMCGRL